MGSCDGCQCYKFSGPGYGHVPPQNDTVQPWEEVAVDLVGPWTINLPLGRLSILALTILDTTSTLYEKIRIESTQV